MEDASGTDHVRCGEGGWLSLPFPWKGGRGGGIRPLIVSNLKWGWPCRGHYVFPAV